MNIIEEFNIIDPKILADLEKILLDDSDKKLKEEDDLFMDLLLEESEAY